MKQSARKKNGYGDFGNLSKNYAKARKGFPDEAYDYIFQKIRKDHPLILDIGCGTGIASEQLCEKGAEVSGTDIDADMIREAKANNRYSIEYRVARAEKQPFKDRAFDAVTAFSAFHWFANKSTLHEIKRVLKPAGLFFAVNKNETGDFKKRNKEILRRFIEETVPDIKKEYEPKRTLEENGFVRIEEKIFSVTEYFSPKEALGYIQTMSVWNLVPDSKKKVALENLREHFEKIAINEKVERKLDIGVMSGISN
ncbi:MAG: hypothetical protein A3H57_00975 [Candidatus Taylorbacteria bacterium RIFCSPLOWO2_02_FULL_43_11]|uniref:Methyltransferase type 11 domain-containing protein n=1 Tax=Candidatus Taylorbacteria bacterium RIFCSPHIGHO2_02_FULL_43_32b TaxID=1802306 RepID=A0A1G2MJA5_9BACT|nr:MAG: hypothetical protein A2743_04015 [Candidatus Taylorbacteria bacterium RIFCSPHIGHO2_01_FULL_43_47]OHA24005.1 MAG: hypothetical protein A3C72_02575 [Candidatus Taylorbacteria bacterium RIFCSPHIGHO2_02_FULL_43_32b]OHA31023.1 MAG: hypothetical protein A3B08_03085 [Candidatus Taylorbacteria bacterium RIFCSPLOWO2_01_FULL_43_44]OHA37706.1 MAG: hypothetical protein A3H57_00975 [Candidatus Taylorbacteria bacterium RIFCSPLOWO2_02_FULL_43_11]